MSIHSLLPDPKALLKPEPEELAGVLMQHPNSLPPSEARQRNRHNFSLYSTDGYPPDLRYELSQAVMDAWVWTRKRRDDDGKELRYSLLGR